MIQRWLWLLGVCSACNGVMAQVDQENLLPSKAYSGWNMAFGLRQEFRPTLEALDSVELSLAAGTMKALSSDSGSAILAVREGAIDGPVIGTSLPVEIPALFSGLLLFRFEQPVALVPGELYALEPLALSTTPPWPEGHPSWAIDGSSILGGGYPEGRLWFNGGFVDDPYDLIFREGIGVPEPSALVLLGFALAILFGRIAPAVRFCSGPRPGGPGAR